MSDRLDVDSYLAEMESAGWRIQSPSIEGATAMMRSMAPSPWIAGESTAYQKRNADAPHRDHLAWCLQDVIRKGARVLDIGGGNGHRCRPWVFKDDKPGEWLVVDGHDQKVVPGASYERADLECWTVPTGYDVAIFGYVLHWLEESTSRRLLTEAAARCRFVAIDDFFPDGPIDVPYAHREGIVTRKRRYGDWLPESCKMHGQCEYPYNDQHGGEPCRAAVWRTNAAR